MNDPTTTTEMGHHVHPEDHGARADGTTMDTEALQASVDACAKAGGGVVICGPGIYLTGSIELKSNVELHLSPGCELLASPNIDDYDTLISEGFNHEVANENTAYYLIGAKHAKNVAITGSGKINGQGPLFYDQTEFRRGGQFKTKPDERARLVMFHKCVDVRFEDTTYLDCPCWTFWLMKCEQVQVRGLKIFTDRRMINADGIDFDSCRNVTVSDCVINAEDDCLVFRAIQKVHDEPAVCENVTVTNCVLDSMRNCVRISCPSDHVTRNCVFSNLTMHGKNGVYFHFPKRFLDESGKGAAEVSDVLFSNLTINCEDHPVNIHVDDGVELKKLAGITFSNVRATSGGPCVIKGSPETIVEDVRLHDFHLTTSADEALVLSNCRGVKLDGVEVANDS